MLLHPLVVLFRELANNVNSFCCILNVASINLTWILTVLGVIVGGASLPVGLMLLWSRMSTVAVKFSPLIGFGAGVISWFVVTYLRSGSISVATTGDPKNAVAGNITAWGAGGVSAVALSLLFPKKFESTDEAHLERRDKIAGIAPPSPESITPPSPDAIQENEKQLTEQKATTGNEVVDFLTASHIRPLDAQTARRATRLAVIFNVLFLTVAILFVPFLLFGGAWVFSKPAFIGWCVVSFMWVWWGMVVCVIWPVVESRSAIMGVGSGVLGDLRRRWGGVGKEAESADDVRVEGEVEGERERVDV